MKLKIIIVVIVVILVGAAGGFYWYYETHLRFTDSFTDCPVTAFRSATATPESAIDFVTEQSLSSLKITERCGLDCRNGNHMACVIYGVALQKGVFVMESASESSQVLSKACNRGEPLACQLEEHAREVAEQEAKAQAQAEMREKYKGTLRELEKARDKAKEVIGQALAYNGGQAGPMKTGAMLKWYEGTAHYLLYKTPSLSQMHQTGVAIREKPDLKDFTLAKYMGGDQEPNLNLVKEFFEKFMRLGMQQIKLDYYVEKKKEADLPKRHGYFRAKHSFLYNSGTTYLEILDLLEKDINYRIEHSG